MRKLYCSIFKKWLPITEFHKDNRSKRGYDYRCKEAKSNRRIPKATKTERWCSWHQCVHPIEEFTPGHSYCRAGTREYRKLKNRSSSAN